MTNFKSTKRVGGPSALSVGVTGQPKVYYLIPGYDLSRGI
jgi:hypothetical protein